MSNFIQLRNLNLPETLTSQAQPRNFRIVRYPPTTQNLGRFSDGAARYAHRRIAANCSTRSSAYLSRSLDSYLLTVMPPRLFCFKTVAMLTRCRALYVKASFAEADDQVFYHIRLPPDR
jgi:hypothetical protein